MQTLLLAFIVSFATSLLIIRLRNLHLVFTGDRDDWERQKYHTGVVPRVGGVAILAALLAALGWSWWRGIVAQDAWWLLVATLPILAAGLAEDVTKRVSPRTRLAAAFVAAGLGVWLLQAYVDEVGVAWLDAGLGWKPWPHLDIAPVGLALTLVGVAGLTHAINIIDGFHGLSSAVSMLIFGALGYVGWIVGDALIVQMCLAMIGGLAGFLLWNYPRGLIFLGDGGAYLVGFIMAQTGVLLTLRNPQVSPWFPLLACAYPIIETLFSIYRKLFIRNVSPALPDGLHMHILIYRRLLRWAAGPQAGRDLTARNAATSPYLWVLSSLAIGPAAVLWSEPAALQAALAIYVVTYLALYRKLVRFRAPRWLKRSVGQRQGHPSSR